MKITLLAILLAIPASAFGATTCYELSSDGYTWSRTPEVLCIDERENGSAKITLETGITPLTVATINFDLTQRARCMDCKQDVFSLSSPSNSIFNELSIRFNGTVDSRGSESGTVSIGNNSYFYRR